MKAVIERVKHTKVIANGQDRGEIPFGLLIFLGVGKEDTEDGAIWLADKIAKMRIFSDENGKMNLSALDIGGSALVVSNFTLLANYKKGNRPDYMNGAKPDEANRLYEYFCKKIAEILPVEKGVFGADMQIEISNDGPVTIVMDSEVLK
jgi:D-tyrosyl-tRNA(Tyr) deacylase